LSLLLTDYIFKIKSISYKNLNFKEFKKIILKNFAKMPREHLWDASSSI